MLENHPELGEDVVNDHNQIEQLLHISYFLKTFKLIVIIFNISYFLGLVWIIFCDFSLDLQLHIWESLPSPPNADDLNMEFFREHFSLNEPIRTKLD